MSDSIKAQLENIVNDIKIHGSNIDSDIELMNKAWDFIKDMNNAGINLGNAIYALGNQKGEIITARDAILNELKAVSTKLKALSERIKNP